jgi:chromosome segregation ATPase
VVNAGGSMTGGSVASGAKLLGRRTEILRLEEEAKRLLAQAQQQAEPIRTAQEELSARRRRFPAWTASCRLRRRTASAPRRSVGS